MTKGLGVDEPVGPIGAFAISSPGPTGEVSQGYFSSYFPQSVGFTKSALIFESLIEHTSYLRGLRRHEIPVRKLLSLRMSVWIGILSIREFLTHEMLAAFADSKPRSDTPL
ncbi:MAG: hypothetical protein QNJ46_01625 [Leptolyngbyaceae cyanobacterium MO_188.B28]|nr:hypothetical protein [Leptolyngbyaceae cyanobacterium MO_188.B28]